MNIPLNEVMSDDNSKKQPLLETQETTALISPPSNDINNIERFDSELSLSRLQNDAPSSKSSKNLNPSTLVLGDDEKNESTLIRSLSPRAQVLLHNDNDNDNDNDNLMDIQMNMNMNMNMNQTVNTEITEDASEFFETQGGGKIYIDPSYIPRHFEDDDDELTDLRKSTQNINQIKLELDPSWTPFECYKSDLCFICLSILMDLCAIVATFYIFIDKDKIGKKNFDGSIDSIPYPTGYEILRCLFIPLFVYIINRILHFAISKSIKYLYLHGEKTLFVTLRAIESCNRHFIDICMVFVFGAYIYIICLYWHNKHDDDEHNNNNNNGWFDKLINEDIWVMDKYIGTKSITWFMFIIFMIIYVFDIYCSTHYGYIYYRFYHYARYNSMRGRNIKKDDKKKRKSKKQIESNQTMNVNLQNNTMTVHFTSANLKEFEETQLQNDEHKKEFKHGYDYNYNYDKTKRNDHMHDLGIMGIMHINKSVISDSSKYSNINTEATVSIMTLEDVHNINNFNYKDYNPHIHDDIATLRVNKYNKKKHKKKHKKQLVQDEKEEEEENININIDEYGARHYSLFEANKMYKKSLDDTKQEMEDVVKYSNMNIKRKRKRKRKRSRSESDLALGPSILFTRTIASSINSEDIISPRTNERSDASLVMELREKVNFLKATLFAKQSILDQFKLDLNEQTFIISNVSLKIKRIENEKQELERELIDKNEELDEKKILLQVGQDTQKELEKECNRLSQKLKQISKSSVKKNKNKSKSKNKNINDENYKDSIVILNSPSSKESKKKKKNK